MSSKISSSSCGMQKSKYVKENENKNIEVKSAKEENFDSFLNGSTSFFKDKKNNGKLWIKKLINVKFEEASKSTEKFENLSFLDNSLFENPDNIFSNKKFKRGFMKSLAIGAIQDLGINAFVCKNARWVLNVNNVKQYIMLTIAENLCDKYDFNFSEIKSKKTNLYDAICSYLDKDFRSKVANQFDEFYQEIWSSNYLDHIHLINDPTEDKNTNFLVKFGQTHYKNTLEIMNSWQIRNREHSSSEHANGVRTKANTGSSKNTRNDEKLLQENISSEIIKSIIQMTDNNIENFCTQVIDKFFSALDVTSTNNKAIFDALNWLFMGQKIELISGYKEDSIEFILSEKPLQKTLEVIIYNEIKEKLKLKENHKLPSFLEKIQRMVSIKLSNILPQYYQDIRWLVNQGDFGLVQDKLNFLKSTLYTIKNNIIKDINSLRKHAGGAHKTVEYKPGEAYGRVSVNPENLKEFKPEQELERFFNNNPDAKKFKKYFSIQQEISGGNDVNIRLQRAFTAKKGGKTDELPYKIFEDYVEEIRKVKDPRLKEEVAAKLLLERLILLALKLYLGVEHKDGNGGNQKVSYVRETYEHFANLKTDLHKVDYLADLDWGHLKIGKPLKAKADIAFDLNIITDLRTGYTSFQRWRKRGKLNIFMHKTPIAHILSLVSSNYKEAASKFDSCSKIFSDFFKKMDDTEGFNPEKLLNIFEEFFLKFQPFFKNVDFNEILKSSSLRQILNEEDDNTRKIICFEDEKLEIE